jgi:hypothetical protein
MEFGLLKFSSVNLEIFEIPQALLSTNVAGNNPVELESTKQFIFFSQMVNHDFTFRNSS